MGKRTVFEDSGKVAHAERPSKRQRTDEFYEQTAPSALTEGEVASSQQLQKLLVFDQSNQHSLRAGLGVFKTFLDSILYSTEEHALPRKRAILREYLDTQKGRGKDGNEVVFLPQIIQAWDHAVETNFEPLLSHITANFALLLKVLGTNPDFEQYGALLCKTIMKPPIARRLVRNLSAATSKENVILPAIRLLIEITKFNEGAFARDVYKRKEFTLEPKILARNIGTWRDFQGQTALDLRRKPSVRTAAVRYFLMHLKYQDERAKAELLTNQDVVRSVFNHLNNDPPFLIAEVLEVFKSHIFLDKTIPRHVKSRILNGKTLSIIAGLYKYEPLEGTLEKGEKAPDELAHDFLRLVCTSPAYGVMLPAKGLYPHLDTEDENTALGGFPADEWHLVMDAIPEKPARVRNVVLADFIQILRPYANIRHQELVIELFKACPELVHDYFHRKQDFNYDPKLTSTWIGFSGFLYQTIELPVPQYFGTSKGYQDYPPPVPATVHSVLPQPLTQQVLVKCLNSSSDLIQFFAVRILTVAFHKLLAILKEFDTAHIFKPFKSWNVVRKRIHDQFSRRCPPMKTIITAFRQPAFQKGVKREAITRLIRLYYEVTPSLTLADKFDVSVPLCSALMQAEKRNESDEDRAFCVLELEHWTHIAMHSHSMRWWQKNKALSHSPFVMLLKLLTSSTESSLYRRVKALVSSVVRDYGMLELRTSPNALDILIATLSCSSGSSALVLEFLDNCCARFTRQPIDYFDDLDALCAKTSRKHTDIEFFSPLLMTLVEQWPFKGGKCEKGNSAEPLAQWLSTLLYLLKDAREDETLLGLVRDALVASADKAYQDVLQDSFLWKIGKEKAKQSLMLANDANDSTSERSSTSPLPSQQPQQPEVLAKAPAIVDLELPPEEDERHTGLNRWRTKDIDESMEDGDIGELILCLCSQYPEIRLQAATNIRQLMSQLDRSAEDFQQQLYLLLGETLETATNHYANRPFPYVGGVFAAHCIKVILDAAHDMFPKICTFLCKRPSWSVRSLPRKFFRIIVNSAPEEDGSYHREVDWYLDYLLDCLRTQDDMEIFRTSNMFEPLLCFYASKSCAIAAKDKIVRLLLRAVAVGGSTTLITRCGLMNWIRMMIDNRDHRQDSLKVLAKRLYELCDRERVDNWSGGTMDDLVASIAGRND